MKTLIFVAVALACVAGFAESRPDLVKRVAQGEIQEARVSWWGFDAEDSTRFLQAALASPAKKIVLDRMETPWHACPLTVTGKEGFELFFERGAELVAKRGSFTNRVEALLTIQNSKEIRLSGYGAAIRMWRCDYVRAPYCWSEWRHALSVRGVSGVTVEGLRIEESGGDGIYLTGVRDCTVRDVICDRNHRQGISVISAENLLIENCTLSNTKGTLPEAGIDFEPNRATERLVNCVMRNCTISGNEGAGIDMALVCLNGKSRDVSFLFENCRVIGNKYGLRLGTENPPLNSLKGVLEMRNCLFDRSENGVSFNQNDDMPIKLKFKGCVLRTANADGELVETPMDDAWVKKLFPCSGASSFPDVRHVSDRALDRAKIHDDRPGEMVAFSPLRIRHAGHFVFYASKAGDAHFTASQLKLGKRGRLSTRRIGVKNTSGKVVAGINMSEIGEKKSPFTVTVPAAGFYFFDVGDSGALFALLSADVPVALDVTDTHLNLNSSEGAYYLPVPENAQRFAFFVGGSYPAEAVDVKVFDPSGKEFWHEDSIVSWRMCFSPEKPMSGVWKLEFSRSPGKYLDDFKCEVAGVPGFLFLSPEKYWCAPVLK